MNYFGALQHVNVGHSDVYLKAKKKKELLKMHCSAQCHNIKPQPCIVIHSGTSGSFQSPAVSSSVINVFLQAISFSRKLLPKIQKIQIEKFDCRMWYSFILKRKGSKINSQLQSSIGVSEIVLHSNNIYIIKINWPKIASLYP